VATIDHVGLRVSDLDASLALFDECFELLAFAGRRFDGDGFYEWGDFVIAAADDARPRTSGAHVGFTAGSRRQVDSWWQALTFAGHSDDGGPGLRPEYEPGYYGAFIRDPDGNSLEAVHSDGTTRQTGAVDHVWIRVSDLAASKRFYAAVGEATGAHVRDHVDRLQLATDNSSLSVLEGPVTLNLHLAIGVGDAETVRAFHRAGLEAGGLDNGAPGERAQYHSGYYAAYLLDPDGNNIEAVWHNRS
jgi:catechol 2,3-dioxygenase-like lactoylglutathione lyase family enzyme